MTISRYNGTNERTTGPDNGDHGSYWADSVSMITASLIASGLALLRQKGFLDELAARREIRPRQVRRFNFRSETTIDLDRVTAEYTVTIRTVEIEKVPSFRIEFSNLTSIAGENRLRRPGKFLEFVEPASVTGWLTKPSFAESIGSSGLPLAALLLPRIGERAGLPTPGLTSPDGVQIAPITLSKSATWPEILIKIPVTRGPDEGYIWLRTRLRKDGWPDVCDGNFVMGNSTILFRLERI